MNDSMFLKENFLPGGLAKTNFQIFIEGSDGAHPNNAVAIR